MMIVFGEKLVLIRKSENYWKYFPLKQHIL